MRQDACGAARLSKEKLLLRPMPGRPPKPTLLATAAAIALLRPAGRPPAAPAWRACVPLVIAGPARAPPPWWLPAWPGIGVAKPLEAPGGGGVKPPAGQQDTNPCGLVVDRQAPCRTASPAGNPV